MRESDLAGDAGRGMGPLDLRPDPVLESFPRDSNSWMRRGGAVFIGRESDSELIDPLLLTAARVCTFERGRMLTTASGFFFERDGRLYLVTSRHVVIAGPTRHYPDRLEIELHTDPSNLASSTGFSIPLYRHGRSVWRQGTDAAGEIDVAVIEMDRAALPGTMVYRAFTPAHLPDGLDAIEVGSSLLVVGFPLGFHDTLHHMPVVRQAVVASSFGLRFQGQGYFLTDARTHRGTSGAPVVMNGRGRGRGRDTVPGDLHWMLLGVHSARLDVGTRDLREDEALGLNCAWYADILMTLTKSSEAHERLGITGNALSDPSEHD